jgi:predicted dehydrogenase
VRSGAIGRVLETERVSHYGWTPLAPFGWPHRLDQGGGRLNNHFTHTLAIVLNVIGGTVLAAAGETRNDLRRAPVGPPFHDFRQFLGSALSPEEAAKAEWREVDSDWSYTVLARIGPPGSDPREGVSASFRHSALRVSRVEDSIAFYGEDGTLHIPGAYAQAPEGIWLRRGREAAWEQIPIPDRIRATLPAINDDTQRNWTHLAREFVADIRGEGNAGYLTFRDGWLFQEVIDIVRAAAGWALVDG